MAEISVYLPSINELACVWHEVEPILRRATDRSGSYEPVDILGLAFGGRAGVWFVRRDGELIAVAATRVERYPRNSILQIPFIAGRFMREWHKPLLAALEEHAKAAGCAAMQGFDRRGWGRVAGFRETGVILERRLDV